MSIQEQAARYMELVRQGVPAPEAYRQAFPNGIPTQADMQREAAKKGQKNGLAQVGGTVAGALGSRAVFDAVRGQPILGIKDWGSIFSSSAPDVAGQVGSNLAANEAANATWNAGADAALNSGTGVLNAPTTSALGSAASMAGGALGAYGLYDLGKKWGSGDRSIKGAGLSAAQGAASGAALGTIIPGVGNVVGGILGGVYGLASSLVNERGSKGKQRRDAVRRQLEKIGLTNEQDKFQFQDGTSLDVSEPEGADKYHVANAADPNVQRVMHISNAMGAVLGGDNDKYAQTVSNYLTNAALQGGNDVRTADLRLGELYSRLGLGGDAGYSRLNELRQSGKLNDEAFNRLTDGWSLISGTKAPAGNMPQPQQPSALTMAPKPQSQLPAEVQQALNSGNIWSGPAQITPSSPLAQALTGARPQLDPGRLSIQRPAGMNLQQPAAPMTIAPQSQPAAPQPYRAPRNMKELQALRSSPLAGALGL